MYDPNEDGITHINCYSKGQTELGRLLSNFACTPFECPDGAFMSIEGYWYWLGCEGHPRREELRGLCGFKAKQLGRELRAPDYQETEEFKEKIWFAVRCKISRSGRLRSLLMESTLPLVHYYVYGGKVHHDPRSDWLWQRIQARRDELKQK